MVNHRYQISPVKPLELLVTAMLLLPVNQLAALELKGELVQGAMLVGSATPGTRVWLNGEALKISPAGAFVFGFGRDAAKESLLKICEPRQQCATHVLSIGQRRYRTQHVNGVPSRTVKPPAPEVAARIADENRQVAAARSLISDRADFAAPFRWPVTGPVTGVFGSQRVYNGEPRRPHYGVDIARPTGTGVAAPAAAIIRLAHPDMFYSGGTLIMDHGHGVSSTFIHLSKILVDVGQEVAAGEIVAEIGATGRATGPHLDWRMNWFKQRLDPQLLVGPMPAEKAQEKRDD